ncbi:MAG: ATP-binding protein [Aquificae bacterium]|nr:ATP-binding protein [Aquificota bacterium]
MEVLERLTGKCQHDFAVHEIESDNVVFKNFMCKKCKYSFVKKIQKENISFPELEHFKKYLNKPYQKTLLNEDIINSSLNAIKEYAKGGKIRGLIFHDKRGTGKTHLAIKLMKIFKAKLKKSIYALNFSSFVLDRVREINLAKSGLYNQYNPPATFDIENEALETDVLLLDEVGKGNNTTYVNALLYTFVNNAYMNEDKFLIITTNLSPSQFEEGIDDAVVSRLYEICEFVSFNHLEDYRRI